MITVVLLCMAVSSYGQRYGPPPSPTYPRPSGPIIPILRDDRQGPDTLGNYRFNFETGNGISRHEQGTQQVATGTVAMQGGWSFTLPDGTPAVFNFVADADGYRVESPLLPTPPPLPAHAIAQIEKARREDATRGNRYSSPSATSSRFTSPSTSSSASRSFSSPSAFSSPARTPSASAPVRFTSPLRLTSPSAPPTRISTLAFPTRRYGHP